ncbi:MAG TPA: hypothetical protein VK348_10585 [Planctomycetota bacterium]|nr:hypothetical protein [Planctomycetota bacterium]
MTFAHLLLCQSLLAASLLAGGDELFTVSPADGNLRVIDPLTGSTQRVMPIFTALGVPAQACNGLALHPFTGQLWVLVRTTASSARRLATLDPATAIATEIGPTSDAFAGLAFRADGTLLAVTGDGATVPETLYTLNLTNATATLLATFGAGSDGEAIAFDPIDGFLYHASGFGVQNTDEVFERVDAFTGAATTITLSGFDYDELLGFTHWTGGNLLATDLNNNLVVVNTSGHVSLIAVLDHSAKGLVFLPSANTTPFRRSYGAGCAGSSGEIPLLWGTGSPGRGQGFTLELIMAPANGFGILAGGFGTGAVPLPSPQCQVQINPVGFSLAFFATAAGTRSFAITVPANLPPNDFYFQTGLLDSGAFLVANPLQIHVQ